MALPSSRAACAGRRLKGQLCDRFGAMLRGAREAGTGGGRDGGRGIGVRDAVCRATRDLVLVAAPLAPQMLEAAEGAALEVGVASSDPRHTRQLLQAFAIHGHLPGARGGPCATRAAGPQTALAG